MLTVVAEHEHYLVVPNCQHSTVVERRTGRFYPLRNGIRHGLDLDDAELTRQSGTYSEQDTRSLLARVATQWRDLCEHLHEARHAGDLSHEPTQAFPALCSCVRLSSSDSAATAQQE